MGNSIQSIKNCDCCGKSYVPEQSMENVDEFYDPFVEMNRNVITDPQIVSQHGPSNGKMLNRLPTHIIKK